MSKQRPERLLADSSSNTKLRKSEVSQYRIVSLALSPADEAGTGKSNCPQATSGCKSVCVGGPNTGLASVFSAIMHARAERTRYLQEDREAFLRQLAGELEHEQKKAETSGRRLVARLNTFSDIPWEHQTYGRIPQQFKDVIFYDYTKVHSRIGKTPENYHLVASWSEDDRHQETAVKLLLDGWNVAVPFAGIGGGTGYRAYEQSLPKLVTLHGHRFAVLDGDISDLRFEDAGPSRSGRGNVIGLRLKSGSFASRDAAIAAGFAVIR